ncbi:MAG TPA: prepilin-type N-terminal cleavage/methylation domain-containing protein [Candidatus Dojkabacteria bacterium]|nr:prepilin-type N-terminal cleavage/methylation domain-containing protein [Candidatus Dojkabacteria bacterium]
MVNNIKEKKLKGFSLLEIIVTLGIMMLFAGIVFPVGVNKSQKTKLESYASQLVTDIYYQQQRSSYKNISSGVSLGVNSYILFDGDSLSTATYTEVKQFPSNTRITSIALTASNEILFSAGEFKPTVYGTLVLTDGTNTVEVYINREGLVGYE